MKDAFYSIRFRVWLIFVCFSLLIIGFLYIFQIVMLPSFYERMKIRETSTAASEIKEIWQNHPEDLVSGVSDIAGSHKMYIQVSDRNRLYARSSSTDKTNLEIYSLITSLDRAEMEVFSYGGDEYYTATIPRSDNDSKALILASEISPANTPNSYYHTNGAVHVYIFNYLEPLGTTLTIIYSQLNLTAVIIVCAAFVLSLFFSGSITRPIVAISKSALKLPQGEFNMDPEKCRFSEIKDLANTLSSASEEIAKADNLRKDLMANISHDLRTPLTMIKAYAEMIRDLSGDNPEKRGKHLQVIIEETDRLSSLVTDILDLSKLQSGVTQINCEDIEFSEHLTGLVTRFSLLDEVVSYKVILNAQPDIRIFADITKIDQVIYNFINNALTYTGDDKTVRVNLYRKENNTVRLEVCDSGIGIDEENLKYVWDRYYKVKHDGETHRRAVMGSGLGLSIVKGILELHKFNYGVDSKPGEGSTFWFECPEYTEAENEISAKKARRIKKEKE